MELLGYVAAVLIGISLGLIGGGGSILTVPVLVYLFGIDATLAISYSLFIVGITSLVGALRNYLNGQVHIRTALLFGFTSIVTVFLTRKWLIPMIPEKLFYIGGSVVTKATATLVLFAVLMLVASISMIQDRKQDAVTGGQSGSYLALGGYGVLIGMITGLLGAGGGFLLIPALVLLVKLPMKKAVGTSLLIIALNSLTGFTGDLGHFDFNWFFLLQVTAIAVAGIFIGTFLSKRIDGKKLRKGFGWFVLAMGIYILIKELYIK